MVSKKKLIYDFSDQSADCRTEDSTSVVGDYYLTDCRLQNRRDSCRRCSSVFGYAGTVGNLERWNC